MTLFVISNQLVNVVDEFHFAIGQLFRFIIGMVVSLFMGFWLLPYVYTLEDLLWYFVAMVVPLVPFMVGMERCKT